MHTTAAKLEPVEINEPKLVSKTRKVRFIHVLLYAVCTGDWNPIHLFNCCAKSAGFSERVAHGGLVQGIAKDLIRRSEVETSPDKGLPILASESWQFDRPVFMGDQLFVEYTVKRRETAEGMVLRISALVLRKHVIGAKCFRTKIARGQLTSVIKQS